MLSGTSLFGGWGWVTMNFGKIYNCISEEWMFTQKFRIRRTFSWKVSIFRIFFKLIDSYVQINLGF